MRRVVEGEHLFQTSLGASIIERGDLVLGCEPRHDKAEAIPLGFEDPLFVVEGSSTSVAIIGRYAGFMLFRLSSYYVHLPFQTALHRHR
jgi:hypothetical protein